MHDETHESGVADRSADSVLRPFEAPAPPPLPPVAPSQVVPESAAVAVADPPVPEVTPPSADASTDDVPPDGVDVTEVDVTELDAAEDTATGVEAAEDVADADAVDFDAAAERFLTDSVPEPADTPTETITLPRRPFLVGLGVLLATVAVLAALWQSGGDDTTATIGNDAVAPDVDAEPVVDDPPVEEPVVVDEVPVDPTTAADLAEARAEVASLESVVETLQDRPPPALDGSLLRRIVVGADAKALSARPDSIAVVGAFGGLSLIDPETNRVSGNANLGPAATRVMRTSTSVWVTNYADSQLIRYVPATGAVAARFPFPGPDGIVKDGDTIVVASFDRELVARVDPNTGAVVQQVDVGGQPTAVISDEELGLWVAVFDTGELVEIDRSSFEVLRRIVVGQGPVGITAGPSMLWVANHEEGTIAKVDPVAGEVVLTVPVGDGPTDLVVANDLVWVTVTDDGSLVEVDVRDGEIRSITPLGGASAGGGPSGISSTEGTLWIAMQGEQSVVRVDLP